MQPFSIPVQITLQGGRKRQGRTDFPTSGKGSCRVNSHGEPPGAHGKLPTSAGEDRATKLGFAMMGSSVLMFFLLGTTVLKPLMLSVQREETNCTAIHAHVVDVWLDCTFICGAGCHGLGKYPCVQVFVNLTHLGQEALLHYDEEAVHINPQCFYTPKCHQEGSDLLDSALDIKEFFDRRNGTPFACFYSPASQLEDVVLIKQPDPMVIFHCLLWPSLTLLGGALIVGLVRATQHLSALCERRKAAVRAEGGGRVASGRWHRPTSYGEARSQGKSRGSKIWWTS